MMKRLPLSLIISLLMVNSSQILFATDKNVGTSGAQFLKIGVGARPTAMGEAFVAVADDINSVYYNPAGLSQLDKSELTAMHTEWFQGLNYDFGAFAIPTSRGTWGFSVSTLKSTDLEKRDVNEATGGSFESLDAAYGISYGKKITEKLNWGLTGRYIYQKLDTSTAKAWGGDGGVLYHHPTRPLQLGLSIRNLGKSIKFNEVADPQPLVIDGGIAMKALQNRLCYALDIKKPRDNKVLFGAGVEWKQKLVKEFNFSVRSGYNSSQTDAGGATGISLGGGMGYKQFDIDFAWVPMGDLGNTFRYSARLKF